MKDGGHRGGVAWTRGALAHLLANRVYRAEVRHRDQHFPGEHEAIVGVDLWDSVQTLLAADWIKQAVIATCGISRCSAVSCSTGSAGGCKPHRRTAARDVVATTSPTLPMP